MTLTFYYKEHIFFRFVGEMAFKLKIYEPSSTEIFHMREHILDIIGPVMNWPPEIRNLFFKTKLTHIELVKISSFANVNGLDPDLLVEWCDKMKLHKDKKS